MLRRLNEMNRWTNQEVRKPSSEEEFVDMINFAFDVVSTAYGSVNRCSVSDKPGKTKQYLNKAKEYLSYAVDNESYI